MKNLAIGLLTFVPLIAFAPPLISNPGFSGGIFQFFVSTDAIPNTGYVVEYKSSWNDASWVGLTSFFADGQVHQVKDATPAPDRRFYRVRAVNIAEILLSPASEGLSEHP